MKQVFVKSGSAIVDQVPSPLLDEDGVLVEVAYSLISTGTELFGVEQSGKSLVRRALEQPEKVQKLIDHLRSQGIQKTIAKVREKTGEARPTGYSCSGIIIQVGDGVTDVQPGDRVVCGDGVTFKVFDGRAGKGVTRLPGSAPLGLHAHALARLTRLGWRGILAPAQMTIGLCILMESTERR